MVDKQTLDSLIEEIKESLKTYPVMLRIEVSKGGNEYRIYLSGNLHTSKLIEGRFEKPTPVEVIFDRVRMTLPKHYISSSIAKWSDETRYFSMMPVSSDH